MEEKPAKKICIRSANELPAISRDFTSQEIWDSFFTSQGVDGFSEWYADWPQLRTLLRDHLSFPWPAPPWEDLSILIPACGNSRLSEHLYDEGFESITNVDFSKVVISAMSGRNVEDRPQMKWSVMDMANMDQFANGAFDAIVDKAGLDALMKSEIAPRSGILYISEVKRLLKAGGKYICLSLAESQVLGLLFSKFRFGWKVDLYAIAQEPSSGTTKQQTFMLVAEKSSLTVVSHIVMHGVESQDNQVHELFGAVDRENIVRTEYSKGTDIWYSLEQLNQGVKGNIRVLRPGRAVKLFLGEPGVSRFFYTDVLLDAHPTIQPFSQYRVSIFKKTQSSQKIMAEESRQWLVLGSLKVARMLMIVLDSSHSNVPWEDIVADVYHFANQLAPVEIGGEITIIAKSEDDMIDGIKQRTIVHQVKTVIIGLGPGILPMFMRNCLPTLDIEVVELDPVVLDVARKYFGFRADDSLKVRIKDAIKFVREKANSRAVHAEGSNSSKVNVLIIDVDSSDSSSGLISPEADFVEESFLLTVKDSLSDNGLFIFKLVTRYYGVRDAVCSKLRMVFSNLYHFYVDVDFVEIIFALKKDSPIIGPNELAEACGALAKSLQDNNQYWAKKVLYDSKLIEPLE